MIFGHLRTIDDIYARDFTERIERFNERRVLKFESNILTLGHTYREGGYQKDQAPEEGWKEFAGHRNGRRLCMTVSLLIARLPVCVPRRKNRG